MKAYSTSSEHVNVWYLDLGSKTPGVFTPLVENSRKCVNETMIWMISLIGEQKELEHYQISVY